MSLADRFEQLEPRERRLLGVLGAVFAVFVLLLIPLGLSSLLSSKREENEAVLNAIEAIHNGRAKVAERKAEQDAVKARYAKRAPPLASFLDRLAKQSGLEIPETKPRAPVPHGKEFEERSTQIVLRKVGLLNLTTFMEKIEQSGYPVTISRLNIRKRGTETDSYDVEMIVSAFDREEPKKKPKKSDAEEG